MSVKLCMRRRKGALLWPWLALLLAATSSLQAAPGRYGDTAGNIQQEVAWLREELRASKQLLAQHEEMLRTLDERSINQQDIFEAQQRHLVEQWNAAKGSMEGHARVLQGEVARLTNDLHKLAGELLTLHDTVEKQNQLIITLQGTLQQVTGALQRHDSHISLLQGAMIALTEAASPSTTLEIDHAKEAAYTVKTGDTLSTIAKKFGITIKELRSLNQLPNDRIVVGQKLSIPAKKTTTLTHE